MVPANTPSGKPEKSRPAQRVEIRIEGCLEPEWAEWFEGMEFHLLPGGESIVKGEVKDQAALFGLIAKLRDLGVRLLAIKFEE